MDWAFYKSILNPHFSLRGLHPGGRGALSLGIYASRDLTPIPTRYAWYASVNAWASQGWCVSLLMPYEGINDYLKVVNDYDRQPT